MPKGLRMPVGVSSTGGVALVDGEENDRKIIWNALGDCYSEHAFQQDIGLGGDMVFDINDAALRARILRRLVNIFAAFEVQKRYKLKRETVNWTVSSTNQELQLDFKYFNIESDEEQSFARVFTKAGR